MLTLYFAPGSSSMAPHIALNEIGVPFEARSVSFAAKGTRAPEILALNPSIGPSRLRQGQMIRVPAK